MRAAGRRRSGAIEPLGAVLRRDTDLRVPASVEAAPIAYRDWEAAVGSRIAARARPIRLERGVLLVRTATSTWSQELSLLTDAILSALRARSIKVNELRFRVGKVDAPERPPAREEVRTSPRAVPLPPPLAQELGKVADEELRAIIARAAAKNLGWQAMNETEAAPPKPQRAPVRPRKTAGATGEEAPTSPPPAARAPRAAGSRSAAPARGTRPGSADRRGKP